MKKIILALLATATVLSPLAATGASAQRHDDRRGPAAQRGPGGPGPQANHRWAKGQRFDRRQASNYQEIGNWQQYRGRRLYAPPRGYHWVRSGNDAVLVAVTGGLIGAVLGGAFN